MYEKLKNALRTSKSWWMKFASALGWVNTRLILTLVYLILIGVMAVIIRLLGKDLLGKRRRMVSSYWRHKDKVVHSLESARHQF